MLGRICFIEYELNEIHCIRTLHGDINFEIFINTYKNYAHSNTKKGTGQKNKVLTIFFSTYFCISMHGMKDYIDYMSVSVIHLFFCIICMDLKLSQRNKRTFSFNVINI